VPSLSPHPHGVSRESLEALIASAPGPFSAGERRDAFARFSEQPVFQPVRPSRYWKHDLAKLQVGDVAIVPPAVTSNAPAAIPFAQIGRGPLPVPGNNDPFTALAVAFADAGTLLDVTGRSDDPIVIDCAFAAGAGFPYVLVRVAAGAAATIVERISGPDGAFGCGLVEIVLAERAEVRYVVEQSAGAMRLIVDRHVTLGAGATLDFADAEIGAALSVGRLRADARAEGARMETTAIFFPIGDQHVDLGTQLRHGADRVTSQTIVRTAAGGRGQGRYFGNIVVDAHTHNCDATLRDDALLLSDRAHIDSIPALEIATNDVKAYHGATVGTIDEDELFYAQSRGISRDDAARMIASGFFEPAIARFPGESLRERLREAIAAKVEQTA
jgi:Fe-S cluster assembly protein SufD